MAHSASTYTLELDFTPQDLLANQLGEVSPRQRELVDAVYATRKGYARQSMRWMTVFFVFIMLVGIVGEYRNSEAVSFSEYMLNTGVFLLIPLGIFAFLMLVSSMFSWMNTRTVRALEMRAAEGYAHIFVGMRSAGRGGQVKVHEVTLKDGRRKFIMRFSGPEPLEHFEQGKFYRVYYVPYYPLPLLLSVEPA